MRCAAALIVACATVTAAERDWHTFSNLEDTRVRHIDLDLTVSFDRKVIEGSATLLLERRRPGAPLVLDTRDLTIRGTEVSEDRVHWKRSAYALSKPDPIRGAALKIQLPAKKQAVRIRYATGPASKALHWVNRGKRPFLFSQSWAIHARGWIPLQDTPSTRITYSAVVRTPLGLLALMSAENKSNAAATGEYRFRMPQAIPPHLMAIAVGDLEFRSLGPRTGVYAEPRMIERAAREFAVVEKMLAAAEEICGPYRWDRYDVLVAPGFVLGGMENARLNFLAPNLVTGDGTRLSVLAHELAHSWAGNLVANANWRHIWISEGLTTYLENRIQEKVFGTRRADLEAVIDRRRLDRALPHIPDEREALDCNLEGLWPDEGMDAIPYQKGALFARALEERYGRERFDAFLRRYFAENAFGSMTTPAFLDRVQSELGAWPDLSVWANQSGIPPGAPLRKSTALDEVEKWTGNWLAGSMTGPPPQAWSAQERNSILDLLPDTLAAEKLAELDRTAFFTVSPNRDVLSRWLPLAVANGYEPAVARLDEYLSSDEDGCPSLVYGQMMKRGELRERAQRIYARVKTNFSPACIASVDRMLEMPPPR